MSRATFLIVIAMLGCASQPKVTREWKPMPEVEHPPPYRQARGACIAQLGTAPRIEAAREEWKARFHGCMNSHGWESVEVRH
jgi:hypothetical protein